MAAKQPKKKEIFIRYEIGTTNRNQCQKKERCDTIGPKTAYHTQLDFVLYSNDLFESHLPGKRLYNKQHYQEKKFNKSKYKSNSLPGCVMFIQVACLWMCILLYFSFVCLHVCACAFKFMVHCGSAFEPGASGLHYYYTPPVCIPAVIGGLAVWRHNNNKKNTGPRS